MAINKGLNGHYVSYCLPIPQGAPLLLSLVGESVPIGLPEDDSEGETMRGITLEAHLVSAELQEGCETIWSALVRSSSQKATPESI